MGEPVPLVFQVANAGSTVIELSLGGRQPTADFEVAAGGRVVWNRLHGQTTLGILRLHPLRPGERLTLRHSWDQHANTGRPVTPGEYTVRAVLLSDDPGGIKSPPARLRIEAPPRK